MAMLRTAGRQWGVLCTAGHLASAAPVWQYPTASMTRVRGASSSSAGTTSSASNEPPASLQPVSSSIVGPQTNVSLLPSLASGSSVAVGGWIISIRRISKSLAFAVLLLPRGQGRLQLIARSGEGSTSTGSDNVTSVMASVEAWERAGIHGAVFVRGKLYPRPKEGQQQNRDKSNQLAHLELHVANTSILNSVPAGSLPFDPQDTHAPAREEARMKHRYLDLRSDWLGDNIRLRSKVSWAVRDYLHKRDFTEIETPILLRSTPEGAREYLVPTRVVKKQPGASPTPAEPQFFALQQSPQQPKQLLIASGVTDRYFQFAKCFRDEDGRKDRQAEFTQIDLEMGFLSGHGGADGGEVQQDSWRIGGREVKKVIEGLVRTIWRAAGRTEEADWLDLQDFRVIKYDEAMARFGSDKPDLRYGLELVDLTDALVDASQRHNSIVDAWLPQHNLEILCFTPPDGAMSNAQMTELFRNNKEVLDGVERFKAPADGINVMAKLLLRKSENVRTLLSQSGGQTNEQVSVTAVVDKIQDAYTRGKLLDGVPMGEQTWLFVAPKAHPPSAGSTKLGDLRRLLVSTLVAEGRLTLPSQPCFAWITEFPLFTLADADKAELSRGRWSSSHHPFTSPVEEDLVLVKQALSDDQQHSNMSERQRQQVMHTCKGQHYDLVLNGVEIGGGSVRVHDAELQRSILKNALQLTPAELARFGHLLQALASGAPPHGGIALGFDRLMSILCDTSTIRDVIAFPKSANSRDFLFECPDRLDPNQKLDVYGLQSAT